MSNTVDYFVLDVFTDTPLKGNALAVVLNPGWLTAQQMLAIAGEMNLSETTFVERRDAVVELAEGVRVRIFTTEEELPFAGHPTLGTASLLRVIAPECVVGETVTLALEVGSVPVRFAKRIAGAPEWPLTGEMTQRDPEFGELLDALTVAELTGLAVEDLEEEHPVQVVSTGMGFAIVVLKSSEALGSLRVRQEEAGAYLRAHGARWFYVLAPTGERDQPGATAAASEPTWRARMQFYGGEDPATGSAAGCAISHLVRYGAVQPGERVHLRQGVEIGRQSDLFLSADRDLCEEEVTNVRVAGSTVLVAKGQLFLP